MSTQDRTETTERRIGGYAPGNYECRCLTCGEVFVGDKRAISCEQCARNRATGKQQG